MMDVSLVLKVAGVGMLVTITSQILGKAGRDEQAMLVSVAGMILVLLMLIEEIGALIEQVRGVFGF
ncbi:MAG: stage III sporulation protein AC [Clostridia bacterium]|nr:stage III sporulation protein AC [Clostridia bacterium]